MGTGRVPRLICALEWIPVTMGTVIVTGHTLAPEVCLGTYGHRKGARAHMGNEMVPRAHIGTGEVPGHIWALE